MNWHLKFTYTCIEKPLPPGAPKEYVENVITDNIDKINFPGSDDVITYLGSEYRLTFVEITLVDIKIVM